MTTFVLGDIHGRIRAFNEVLEKARFSFKHDTLICLGDTVDGGKHSYECVEKLLEVDHLVYCMGNHDCITMDTEILTKRGWLKYSEITTDDVCFSLDVVTNIGQWMPIKKIVVKSYDGNFYAFNGHRLQMEVTGTHRCLKKNRVKGKYPNNWQYCEAAKMKGRVRLPVAAQNTNIKYDILDDKIRLTAWLLTDGWFDSLYKYPVISQCDERNVTHIKEMLDRLKYKYSIHTRNRKITHICGKKLKKDYHNEYTIRILSPHHREVHKYINNRLGIPPWLFNINYDQFKIFIEEIIRANGTHYLGNRSGNAIIYGTHDVLEGIQSLCVTNGCGCTLKIDKRGGLRLNLTHRNTVDYDCTTSLHKTQYVGLVWCITTPMSNFLARKNGTPFFTGNSWYLTWAKTGHVQPEWYHQGGIWTIRSYHHHAYTNRLKDVIYKTIPKEHIALFENAVPYYVKNGNIYVHGGFDPTVPIDQQDPYDLMWDRSLCAGACNGIYIPIYNRVFVGHTSTQFYGSLEPIFAQNLVMCDTGGGWNGKLSMINVDTLEFVQSQQQKPS